MAVTITGGRYSGAITTAGTLTLTDSGASFVSGDFSSTQRIVGLWNSAGTTYKGVAWVRQRTSGTVLELRSTFIDKDGNTVTQVVGDTYLVSKNYADSVAAGLSVTRELVTLTDNIIFGVDGDTDGVCFYDENKTILCNASSALDPLIFRGGLIVHGHLEDYTTRRFSGGCTAQTNSVSRGILIANTSSKIWWMGGGIISSPAPFYLGGEGEWQKWWGCFFSNIDVSGSFSNPADQELADLSLVAVGFNSILQRWSNGTTKGRFLYKLNSGGVLSVFGSDSTGTFNTGSTEILSIIRDAGTGSKPGLWRQGANVVQTINHKNIVTSNRKHNTGVLGSPASNSSGNFRFYGNFAGLQNGTLGLIKNNSIRSDAENSGTVSGSTITLEVLEAVVVGHTETVRENSWLYGFYLYGYQIVSSNFAVSNIATASGNGKAVTFNPTNTIRETEFIGQILDVNITQPTAATVAAYTTLDTLDQVYDYAQWFKASSTTNAIYPTVANKLIDFVGGALTTPTAQNITINTAAGSVFAASAGTITIKPTTALTGGTKGAIQLSASQTLTFTQNGDKSAVSYRIPATGIVVVAPGATNLVGSMFATGATVNVSSSTATVTVSSVTGITAGAGVTLVLAPSLVSLTVTGPADYYVTIIQSGSRLNTSDTGIQSGTYAFSTAATGSAFVRVRRQGWRDFQTTISLASGTTATVGALLTQETGGAGNPLYSGTTSTLITVTIDGSDANHKINWTGNGSANAQFVYDAIHDAKVSAAGMLVTGLQVNYLRVVPFLEAIILPSTFKFRNQTPANLNCVFEGFASQAAGALVDDASGNGAIRVVASLGVTQQQVADAALLAPTVGLTAATLSISSYIKPIAKQLGLVTGVTATHTPTAIPVSDGDGSTTITDNGGGSYTVESA